MSSQHRVLLQELAAHAQDQPTKARAQVVQAAAGEPMGVKGEGTRSRSCGLSAHQVLARLVCGNLTQVRNTVLVNTLV